MAQSSTPRIVLVEGDITEQSVDAVVNAANEQLLPGGGVCGAIHRRGGPVIEEECRRLASCPTGSAVTTSAGELPARWVVHAVGPVWRGGRAGEAELLAAAYRSALLEAQRIGARSLAFPALSCGIYGYPPTEAARVALAAIQAALPGCPGIQEVRLVLFDRPTLEAFQEACDALGLAL